MEVTLKGKSVQITDAIRDYAKKKLSKFDKYFDVTPEATVTCSVEKDRHTVEVTMLAGGLVLRAEEESPDLYASIDLVIDIIDKQIKKNKTRLKGRLRQDISFNGDGHVREEEPRVVRTKRFALKPMAVDEAILQMNLVGHDFFVFSNAETEEVNVVYRRRDGNYGLIEPGE